MARGTIRSVMEPGAIPLPRPSPRLAGVCVAAVALILMRSAVFTLWEQADFDSDQAITGLMAKHLSQLRAFPLMYYGQQYMLAVEAWLAAPFFKLFGVSVLTLRLPIIGINVLVALLLLRILVKGAGLSPRAALLASLFFVLAPVVPASRLVEASSNIEAFLYVLLLWLTRANPIAFGLIGGIGFLHREFAAYAIAAIGLLELRYRVFFTKVNLTRKAIAGAEIVAIIVIVRLLLSGAPLLGPGTAHTLPPEVLNSQAGFWLSRFCWNPAALMSNLRWLAQENLAPMFGWNSGRLSDYVRSGLTVGHAWLWLAPAAIVVAAVAAGISGSPTQPETTPPDRVPGKAFPAFLVLVGLQAIAVYALVTCVVQDRMLVRYTLLVLLIPVGLTAFLFQSGRPRIGQAVAVAAVVVWAAASLADHARLLAEYAHRPPRDEYRDFANFLEREGVRYGRAPYWTAYQIDFLTNERVVLGSFDKVRINEYEDLVNHHVTESTAVFFDDPCKDPQDVAFERWCLSYFERARHPRAPF